MDKEFWNEGYQTDPEGQSIPDRVVSAEVVGMTPGRALDLGCGTGQNALALAERGWQVVGVDWSENAIRIAQSAAESRGLDAAFVVGDITRYEPPHQFDLVISTFALPDHDKVELALRTAANSLAEGGTLIVAEWDRSMAKQWDFSPDDLPTPESIVARLPGLEIEFAEVRHMKEMNDFVDEANVAVVRARQPETGDQR